MPWSVEMECLQAFFMIFYDSLYGLTRHLTSHTRLQSPLIYIQTENNQNMCILNGFECSPISRKFILFQFQVSIRRAEILEFLVNS